MAADKGKITMQINVDVEKLQKTIKTTRFRLWFCTLLIWLVSKISKSKIDVDYEISRLK